MTTRKHIMRIGRLGPWHRRASYVVLGACAASGTVWFVLLDLFDLAPPRVVFWWILHGLTGLVALGLVGSVLPTHVPVAWRHARNRGLGGLTLGVLGVVAVSAALLLYGKEDWHPFAHWTHVATGLAGIAIFALHAWLGRRSVARRLHRSH